MAKFFLLDHTFTSFGGHHVEYDVPTLRVAEGLGYDVVFAFDKQFTETDGLPPTWQVQPTYSVPTTRLYSNLELLQLRARQRVRRQRAANKTWRKWIDWLPDLRDELKCRQYDRQLAEGARCFARDTAELFRQIPLERRDQVFMTDAAPLNVVGLAQLLESDAIPRTADWHLLFHVPIFAEREPTWDRDSSALRQLRSGFHQALGALSSERLHFYATTDALADQFNQLELARFKTLQLPAGPSFRPAPFQEIERRPLRAASVGAVRREKGKHKWSQIIDALSKEFLENGDLQIILQAKSDRKLPYALRKRVTKMRANMRADRPDPVRIVPWPLNSQDYAQLILNTAVGLMLYDQNNYYFRVSGVAVEMLNSGIPIVVMAGTSLAEHISEAIFVHHERLLQSSPIVASVPASHVRWHRVDETQKQRPVTGRSKFVDERDAPADNDALSFAGPQAGLKGSLPIVNGASHLLIQFDGPHPIQRGTCLELQVTQQDERGKVLARSREIVGRRENGRRSSIFVTLSDGAEQLELCWKNAFGTAEVTIEQVSCDFLIADRATGASLPAGAVGLIAADIAQVPRLLRDMVTHYPHYRSTARDFAADWAPQHKHAQVVKTLLANSSAQLPETFGLRRAAAS